MLRITQIMKNKDLYLIYNKITVQYIIQIYHKKQKRYNNNKYLNDSKISSYQT